MQNKRRKMKAARTNTGEDENKIRALSSLSNVIMRNVKRFRTTERALSVQYSDSILRQPCKANEHLSDDLMVRDVSCAQSL